MIKNIAAAFVTLVLVGGAGAAFAEEEVSDAVDQALWCGAAYAAVTQIDGMSEDDIVSAEAASTAAFAVAVIAMEEDGIEETEHKRLVDYYVEMAVENLSDPDAELRYSDEDCAALSAE